MATILVVDDNAINRAFLVTLLGYGKHDMLEAANGVDGLALMQLHQPDLVISDILMPNMDGHEFVTHIHATPSIAATPVIFYTAGYHEAEAKVIARACGVTRVLAKPADPLLIMQTVDEALGLPTQVIEMPALTVPPAEGSRFSTIDNQVAEYLVELESSSTLIAQLIAEPGGRESGTPERSIAAKRLAASLANLQAASARLSALTEISREVAAESQRAEYGECGRTHPAVRAAVLMDVQRATPALAEDVSVAGPRAARERARFQSRLAKALQFAGHVHDSPTQLAREFNFRFPGRPITIHAARKWLVGESIPTQDKLRILAQWLGVTAEWLRFGDTEHNALPGMAGHRLDGDSDEARLLSDLLQLDPYHRKLAHDFVNMLATKLAHERTVTRQPARGRPKNQPLRLK